MDNEITYAPEKGTPKDEILDVFSTDGFFLGRTGRKSFYSELEKQIENNGEITITTKTVRAMVMNSAGRIYLQKRSNRKDVNCGLYDKTVGGHVISGTSYDVSLVLECQQEIGVPATVVPDLNFLSVCNSIDLRIIGIFRMITEFGPEGDNINLTSRRERSKKRSYDQPLINAFYLGVYNGPIQFCDGECSGFETFSLDEITTELEANPHKYTSDLHFMLPKYAPLIKRTTEFLAKYANIVL